MEAHLEEVVATRLTRVERRPLQAAAARQDVTVARCVRRLLVAALEREFGKGEVLRAERNS